METKKITQNEYERLYDKADWVTTTNKEGRGTGPTTTKLWLNDKLIGYCINHNFQFQVDYFRVISNEKR